MTATLLRLRALGERDARLVAGVHDRGAVGRQRGDDLVHRVGDAVDRAEALHVLRADGGDDRDARVHEIAHGRDLALRVCVHLDDEHLVAPGLRSSLITRLTPISVLKLLRVGQRVDARLQQLGEDVLGARLAEAAHHRDDDRDRPPARRSARAPR